MFLGAPLVRAEWTEASRPRQGAVAAAVGGQALISRGPPSQMRPTGRSRPAWRLCDSQGWPVHPPQRCTAV
eukprot:10381936-Lingulodinium_polyedra.AAC.1